MCFRNKYEPAQEILVPKDYAQMPPINTHADISGKFKGLILV